MHIPPFFSARQRVRGSLRLRSLCANAQLQDADVQNSDSRQPSQAAQRRHAQAGGSLIEVIVAVTIIAVMSAGLVGSLAYGFLATQLARENQRATQILLEKAEVIRLYNWDQYNYTNNFVPKEFTAVYDPQAPANAQGLTYYGTLTLTNFPNDVSYATNMRQITITLNWTTAGRVPHSRMLTTQIARDGLQNYVY